MFSFALFLGACTKSDSEESRALELSASCTLNSDCEDPLVCAFGRCHVECAATRDCPRDSRCVRSGEEGVFVCQLTDEVTCEEPSDCLDDQVCAVDGKCRDECGSGSDCAREQACVAEVNVCADEEELDEDGNLVGGPGNDDTDDDDLGDDDSVGDDDVGDDDTVADDDDVPDDDAPGSDDDDSASGDDTGDADGNEDEADDDSGGVDGDAGEGGGTDDLPDAGGTASNDGAVVLSDVGGSFTALGVELEVPAGAVTAETELTVTVGGDPPVPLPSNWELLGEIFVLTPHGLEFAAPITLRIPYDQSGVTPPMLVSLPGVGDDEEWSVLSASFEEEGFASVERTTLSYYAVVSVADSGSAVDLSGLVAYYPLDGLATDVAGGNDCVVRGAAWVPDRHNRAAGALAFDGLDQVATCGNDASLSLSSQVSIALWFDPVPDSTGYLVGKRAACSNAGNYGLSYAAELDGTFRMVFSYFDGVDFDKIVLSDAASYEGWTHVAVSFDFETGSFTFFANGVAIGGEWASAVPGVLVPPQATMTELTLGADTVFFAAGACSDRSAGDVLEGAEAAIDDVVILDRVLSADEVQGLSED
jgi:hypothetical protein